MLRAPYNQTSPDFTPEANSPPDDGFFTPVNFIGGGDPANNWLKGWTTNEKPAGQ